MASIDGRPDPNASTTTGNTSTPSSPDTTGWQGITGQNDAFASLRTTLGQYGLSNLADWALQQLQLNRSPNEILLDLYNQPAFQQRFPAIKMREQAGLPALSPGEYVSYENQARQLMQAAGFPPGFYDHPDDFTKYLSNDTSLSELSQRVQLYQQAAYQAPAETRQKLKDWFGIDEGHIAAYLADPDRALPLLQQQVAAAGIAGQAQRQNFGQLNQSEAERLASLGITDAQAAQGFGTVTNAHELFQQLPGEAGAPGRDTALGVVAGDAAAQQAMDEQARRRKAVFAGGGNFASGQTGNTGLGSAST